jgi:TolA-binding protein
MRFQLKMLVVALAVLLSSLGGASLATTQKSKQVDLGGVQAEKRVKKKKEAASTRVSKNEAFLIATETRLLSEIQKALNYLTKTASRLPKKSTDRLQMRDKVINLRLEAAVYHANQEMRRYDKAWEAWNNGGRKGTEPKVDSSRSKEQWRLLAQDGQNLLEEYPKSPKADETLFNMGLAQNFLGREKDAARIFSQLIAKYPNSQKAGDAYFALGDFYFDRFDFRNAMNNYKNALRFKQAKSYNWSLFKLGWCSYNLQQYNQALAYWKTAVTEASKSKRGLPLKEEALRDMIYAFAELRQIEPAIAYYKRNGGQKFVGKFLLLLSQTFSDQGQYGEAIRVLKRYQQEEPTDEAAPDTQKEIISLNFELGRMANVWAELARFPSLYGPSSRWAAKHQSNKKLYLEVQQLIKDQIIYYAKLTHKNAQKDDNKRLYAEAMKGYNLFLKNYPKAIEVAEVKFNMADVYYFAKQYREAAKLYLDICMMGKERAVIADPRSGKKQSIHKDSAEYMLDGYVREFDPEYKVMLKRKPDFTKSPIPLSENAKNLIKGCAYYAKTYPGEKANVKTCDTIVTAIYFRSNDKKNSMKFLWILAKKYPGTKEGDEAVDLLIPLYGKDKNALAKAVAELQKIPAYRKGEIGKKLEALNFGTKEELVQSEKNACKRADGYKKLYAEKPGDKDAFKRIYNAALDYIKCGKIDEGVASYMVVVRKFPSSEAAEPSLLDVAKIQERRLEFAAAAGFYAEYAKMYGKSKDAVGALAKSCLLRAAINSGDAINACLAFAQTDQGTAKAALFLMANAAFSAGDDGRLTGLVRTLDGRFKLSAEEKISLYAMVNNANRGGAPQAVSTILGTYKAAGGNIQGEALRAVGGIVFRQVNGAMAKYNQIKLKGGSVDALAASIQVKERALGELKGAYEQVLQTKDAFWGVAALYQIAHAHELYANELENPPAIAGAKKEDIVKELAAAIKVAKSESAKFYQIALDSVQKYLVYNEWAAKALSGRARLQGKNINFDDLIVRPDFLGAEVAESVARAVKGDD